ncbi:MAG: hypothetical protein ACE5HI_12750 [bacterium]
MKAPIPDNESTNLRTLQHFGIFATSPAVVFDYFTCLPTKIYQTSIVLNTLEDKSFHRFKAIVEPVGQEISWNVSNMLR